MKKLTSVFGQLHMKCKSKLCLCTRFATLASDMNLRRFITGSFPRYTLVYQQSVADMCEG